MFGLMIAIFGLLLGSVIVMYRGDLSREELEADYFMDDSHYLNTAIDDLDGNPITISVH